MSPPRNGSSRREDLPPESRAQDLLDRWIVVAIRDARFGGRCGSCEHADLCGGSRARAFAATGDVLAEDPACAFQPASLN